MTDEEKAEKYTQKYSPTVIIGSPFETLRYYNKSDIYQAHLDGLSEGRKELEQWKQEWQDAQIQANEKENAELKELIEVKKLEKLELKTQIEKMKNVGNCKHSMVCAEWNEKQTILGLMKFCLNCKNWELAE